MGSNPGYEHNRFARSPGYNLSLGVSWDASPRFNVSGQVRHLDGYYSDTANTRAYAVGSNTIADLRMTYADRKSTRLNSSHLVISYAVFCLKKKSYSNDLRAAGRS